MQSIYPPYEYLCLVADHCPRAMSTYLMLWRDFGKQSSKNEICYTRDDIIASYFTWTKFQNDLSQLAYNGVLEFHKAKKNEIFITLAKHEINFEGYSLC